MAVFTVKPRQLTELTVVYVLYLDGKFVAQHKKEKTVTTLMKVLERENVATHEDWHNLPWNPYRYNFIAVFTETFPILPKGN